MNMTDFFFADDEEDLLEEETAEPETVEPETQAVESVEIELPTGNPDMSPRVSFMGEEQHPTTSSWEEVLYPEPLPPTRQEEVRQNLEQRFEGERLLSPDQQVAAAAAQDGVLVRARVGYCRLQVQNNPRDFGISGPGLRVIRGFGSRRLVPAEFLKAFNRAEQRFRKAIMDYTISLPGGQFMPASRWDDFRSTFTRAEADFRDATDRLVEWVESGRAVDWIEDNYAALAQAMWESGVKNHYTCIQYGWTDSEGNRWSDYNTAPPQFVNEVVYKAVSKMPGSAKIREKARFEYTLQILHVPPPSAADGMAAGNRALQREITQQLNEGKAALMDEFIQGVRNALIGSVDNLLSSVNKATDGNRDVHGKTVNKVLRALNDLTHLNVLDDGVVRSHIQSVRAEVERLSNRKRRGHTVAPQTLINELQVLADGIAAQVAPSPETSDYEFNVMEG